MGFGSYDESEQQQQDVDTDDDVAVDAHENDYEGEMRTETGASTDDLLGQLQEIKDDD